METVQPTSPVTSAVEQINKEDLGSNWQVSLQRQQAPPQGHLLVVSISIPISKKDTEVADAKKLLGRLRGEVEKAITSTGIFARFRKGIQAQMQNFVNTNQDLQNRLSQLQPYLAHYNLSFQMNHGFLPSGGKDDNGKGQRDTKPESTKPESESKRDVKPEPDADPARKPKPDSKQTVSEPAIAKGNETAKKGNETRG